ncbi:hypothetical protein SAMN06265795_10871 [Noviherbaspirillum humi]|uniref:Uncharacterized protein n=1 Tax=Noviherbaspirillum humi TaxID=1688639 RepID=A0A239I1Q9_9BURK|nr:hypothetical protein [Noviherbaspirillum humi]SNS87535.1 hypothetical protein SAMN06265795_10871 [Noviherbaspirillum humi]
MSSLNQARESLKAELAHAEQGVRFYQSRIEALHRALASLEQIDDVDGRIAKSGVKARRGRAAATGAAVKPAKAAGKRGRPAGAAGRDLPSTGGSFWIDLIGAEPKTAPELLEAAVRQMNLSLDPAQRKKLAQRMVTAINGLLKSGKIKDSGKGRERRYYRD